MVELMLSMLLQYVHIDAVWCRLIPVCGQIRVVISSNDC